MTPLSSAAELERLLGKRMNTAIISHFNPDGDAVGSSVGMKRFLLSNGQESEIVLPSRHPEFLGFLDPENTIVCYADMKERALDIIRSAELPDFDSLKTP